MQSSARWQRSAISVRPISRRRTLERVELPPNLNRRAGVLDGLIEERGQAIEARTRLLEKERQQIVEIGSHQRTQMLVQLRTLTSTPRIPIIAPGSVAHGGGDGEAPIVGEERDIGRRHRGALIAAHRLEPGSVGEGLSDRHRPLDPVVLDHLAVDLEGDHGAGGVDEVGELDVREIADDIGEDALDHLEVRGGIPEPIAPDREPGV